MSRFNDAVSSVLPVNLQGVKMEEYSNSDLIALTALTMSVAAIFLAIYEGHQNRKHNKLSVRPFLEFMIHSFAQKENSGISVSNLGLGIAIMKSWEFKVDAQAYKQFGNSVAVPAIQATAQEILNLLDLK